MPKAVMTDLQQLALDAYRGNVKGFSVSEADEAIRRAMNEAVGGELNYYNYIDNKGRFFQVLRDVIQITTPEFADFFSQWVETRDLALGDSQEFIIEDDELFRVASIADGSNDLRRQMLYNRKLEVSTNRIGLKIFHEMELFLAGRIEWVTLINKVRRSMEKEISNMIYKAVHGSFDLLSAPYAVTGVFDEGELQDMIAHVFARTGKRPKIYGTAKALAKITNATMSETAKDDIYRLGHIAHYHGTPMVEIPQFHKHGTNEFAVHDDFLLIVPDGEKIVKLVFQGQPTVIESTDVGARNDQQIEFLFTRRIGIAVLVPLHFAYYRLS